jgi:hypothetical protein
MQRRIFLAERYRVQPVAPAQVKHPAGGVKFRDRCYACSHLLEETAPAVLRHGGYDHVPEHPGTVTGNRTFFCNPGKVCPEICQFPLECDCPVLRVRGIPDQTGQRDPAVVIVLPGFLQQAERDKPVTQEGYDLRPASQCPGTYRPGLWFTENLEHPEIKGCHHRMVLA